MARTKQLGALLLLTALATLPACFSGSKAKTTSKKVIVLGIDGMDPRLLEEFMAEGRMPNFAALAQEGHYRRLTTSIPPQSPVAWSNFITGQGPGGHGIFDFIHRDPATLLPYLSTSRVTEPKLTLKLGSWELPLSSGKVELLRDGKAFWQVLTENGIPATLIRIPANFPPVESKARTLAGMGTPDILGTYGTFSYFTTKPLANTDSVSGGRIYRVKLQGSTIKAKLEGPPNSFRKERPATTVEFTVLLDPERPVAKISVQDHDLLLEEGEWSEWVPVKFEMIPYLANVSGIARFYLKRVRPSFELYVTPINLDPAAPPLPLSSPESLAPALEREVGYFHTLGIAEDTKALTAGVFTEDEFLQQARQVQAEQLRIFELEFDRFRSGLFFYYFSSLDQVSHMLWRALDEDHPAYDPEVAARHADVLAELYQEMDTVLGKVRGRLDADTTLLVMSDHGFGPFYRSFNLNTWLLENGYIASRERWRRAGTSLFDNVDWSRTRAYGLGLNALYLNLRGREQAGIVNPEEREALLDELAQKLLAIRDPENSGQVITQVYRADQVYAGPHTREAPDLLIGYNWGYRAGWGTSLGEFSATIFEDNREAWSGDHCIAHDLVPGVLLSNREIPNPAPALTDLAPTILAEFGLEPTAAMTGQPVFSPASVAADD